MKENRIYTVTIVDRWNTLTSAPRSAVFSCEEKASAFITEIENLFKRYNVRDDYEIVMDSDQIDSLDYSLDYLEFFAEELEEVYGEYEGEQSDV